jgi:hypothetical protein
MYTEARSPLTALDPRTIDHLRPLDAVLCALDETNCAWCQAVLRLLLRHLEEYVPVYEEVLS